MVDTRDVINVMVTLIESITVDAIAEISAIITRKHSSNDALIVAAQIVD